jgi:hypothetical protein
MFKFDVLELNDGLEVVKRADKTLYNTDKRQGLNSWVKEKPRKEEEFPNFKSAFNIGEKTRKFDSDSFGYLVTNGNSIEKNASNCYVISGPPNNNKAGTFIYESNFFKCMVVIGSSVLITGDWVNAKDEYLAPDESNNNFQMFIYDSIVLSIFSNVFGKTSIRQVEYKGKFWDIKNEFFWVSKDRIKELADQNHYTELYNDARTSSDRHLYNLLFGEEKIYDKLSPDAKSVLDKATELVEKSIKMRQFMADDENHLDSWDAGYAQLKLVWREHFSDEFKEFRQLYKNLEDRMRPLVYELGFLMK